MSNPQTPAAGELSPRYDPKQVEDEYYRYWEEGGFYHAPVVEGRRPFTIVIPPPNVTGTLHLGQGELPF